MDDLILDEEDWCREANVCRCSNCAWEGLVSDCEEEQEQDGWEGPTYTIHLCPKCEDGGCIDDYWYSAEREED